MKLTELLTGIDFTKVNTLPALEEFINNKANELKAKVLIDDGKEDIYIPKYRLDEEIGKKKSIQSQLETVNTDLKAMQDKYKDNPDVSQQIKDLQAKNEAYEKQMKEQALDSEIKLRAIKAGALDETGSDILKFIDKSKVTIKDDGTFEGLEDAFKSVQEGKSYLFGEVSKGGTGFVGKGKKGTDKTPEAGALGASLAKLQNETSGDASEARASFFS